MLAVSNHIEMEMSVLSYQGDSLQAGEQIRAELIKIEGGKSTFKMLEPQISNKPFIFETTEIPAQVGEVIEFQVQKSEKNTGKNQLTLKPILNNTKELPPQSSPEKALKQISVKVTPENISAAKTLLDNNIEVQKESVKALAEIKKNISYVVNNVTDDKVQLLQEHGFNIEKITLELLCSAMKELNTNFLKPEVTEQEIKSVVDKYIQSEKLSEKDLIKKADKIERLYSSGVPATEKNIQLLESVEMKYEAVTQSELDEVSIAQLLQHEKDLTLSNVYIAKHKGGAAITRTDNTLKELESQIKQRLDLEGLAITNAILDISKFLIQNDIPLTKENIQKVSQLKDIKNQIKLQEIYSLAIENMKQDKEVTDIPIVQDELVSGAISKHDIKILDKKYDQIIADLPKISEDDIKTILLYNKPVTIDELRKNTDTSPDISTNSRVSDERSILLDGLSVDAETIKIKRQLAEIQLKLTKESASRLAGKGIDIDTQPLEQVIDSLKQVEKEIYESTLRMTDTPPTDENIAKMERIYDQVNKLLPTTYQAYHDIIQNKSDFTIDTVANANSAAISKMLDDIETFATVPSAKYGDSFRATLNREIEGVLQDLNIDTTEQNIKAAKILSKTEIDVTEENLTEVKIIDTKIESISNRLHPVIAANMVKDGLNPTEMHVDEVLSYIDKFGDTYGDNLSDKIAKFILEMDDNKTLNPQERESMIAIYRLLNLAKKDESVAIGIALKSESELTLGNLMEASKYYKRTAARREDVDISIGDDFGALEKLVTPQNSIRQILSSSQSTPENIEALERLAETEISITQENINNTTKNIALLNEVTSELSPIVITQAILQNIDISNTPLGEILEKLKYDNTTNDRYVGQTRRNISKEARDELSIKAEEIVNTVKEIKDNEQNILKSAIEQDIDLSEKTISEIENLCKFSINGEIKKETTIALDRLPEQQKEHINQLLADNNMGKTSENIQKLLQILESMPPETQPNNELVKKILHETMVLEQFANEATPEKLQKVIQDIADGKVSQALYKIAVDFRNEKSLKNNIAERRELIEYTEKLQQLADTSQQSIKFLMKNNIPTSLVNILAMQVVSSDPFAISGQLSKLKKDNDKTKIENTGDSEESSAIEDLFESIDTVELESMKHASSHSDALDNLYKKLEDVKSVTESREILEQVKLIQNSTMIQKYSSCMKVPIKIAQDISDLNIYILNDIANKQDITAVMSLQTNGLGVVNMRLDLLHNNVSLNINTASHEATQLLKNNENHLQSLLGEAGYNLENILYGENEEPVSSIFNEDAMPEYPTLKEDFYGVVSKILKYVEISTN